MASSSDSNPPVDDLPVEDADYKVAEKVDVKTLMEMDAADESLRKYKEQLLGAAAKAADWVDASDPRNVIIKTFSVICEGRPGAPIAFDLSSAAGVAQLKSTPIVIKEGAKYRFKVEFKVQRDIALGLKFVYGVYKAGIRVDTTTMMMGAYAPAATITWESEEETAPSGFLARGTFKAKGKFTDDDKTEHLNFDFALEIKKDW